MKKILLLITVAIATTGFAQKLSNQLSFKKGQKLEIVTQTEKTSSIEFMGQSIDTKITSTLNEVLDVTDATAAGTTIEHKVKRLQFTMENPMQSESFDSEKDADLKGEIGKMLEKSIKNKYTVTLDATGKITAVKSDDDNPNGKKKDADMGDLISSQLGMSLGVPAVGSSSNFKILPDKEVGTGDTWTDTSSADGKTLKTVYTVKSITDTDVNLDYNQETNINTTQQIMGQDAAIKATVKATGTITLDKATGLVKQQTVVMNEEGTMEGQGQSIPMKGKTNVTVTIKPAQ